MSNFKVFFITNMLARCAFVAGACFLAINGHEVMGAWCIVGAIICGGSYEGKHDLD